MSKIEVKLNPDVTPTGSDLAVCNAARRSFNTRSEWDYKTISTTSYEVGSGEEITTYVDKTKPTLKDKDKRLIEFLARGMTADDFDRFLEKVDAAVLEDHYGEGSGKALVEKLWQWRNTPTHDTPINHCFISFEVKAPIFVARQLVKHEYLIMSEFSRRYITDDIEFYEPDYWRKAAPNKKQGSLEEDTGINVKTFPGHTDRCVEYYEYLLREGVAPEQARMVLPQSTMTEWTWSGTLGAFCKMCQLRLHPEAQYEARLVAQEVYKHLLEYYPVTAKAFVEGVS